MLLAGFCDAGCNTVVLEPTRPWFDSSSSAFGSLLTSHLRLSSARRRSSLALSQHSSSLVAYRAACGAVSRAVSTFLGLSDSVPWCDAAAARPACAVMPTRSTHCRRRIRPLVAPSNLDRRRDRGTASCNYDIGWIQRLLLSLESSSCSPSTALGWSVIVPLVSTRTMSSTDLLAYYIIKKSRLKLEINYLQMFCIFQ